MSISGKLEMDLVLLPPATVNLLFSFSVTTGTTWNYLESCLKS